MHDQEERERRNRTAEQSFAHARGLLKQCDLLELWKLSARLSLHEALTEPEHPLQTFPLLNAEKVRMLSHTILASRATYTPGASLPSEENFRKIINDCKHALYDPRELEPLARAKGTQQEHLEIQRFLVRTGGVQLPGQEPLVWERTGRLVAMLEDLPQRYPERVPGAQRDAVEKVVTRVDKVLGGRISDLARGFGDVLVWLFVIAHNRNSAAIRRALPNLPSATTRAQEMFRQGRIMLTFLEPEPALDEYFVFTVSRLLVPFDARLPGYSTAARPRVEAFLRLAARSAEELRRMLSQPEFKFGHIGKRLSPLERFPVVRLDDPADGEPRYVVPNYRHFAKSFAAVVDFALNESLGSEYEQARGALFHLYLRQLVEDRLPDTVIIPETRYHTAKGGKDSPDLTLIDPRARRIVPVEVKGRRINLATRLVLGDQELQDNLGDAFEALRKLPGKIVDLRGLRLEFDEWREAIATAGNSPPVLVAVVREGLHGLSHLIREQASLEPKHPLNQIAEPYCLLSADALEKAIELARHTGRSLVELLEEHHRQSAVHDAADPDSFGQSLLPLPSTFAASFVRRPEWHPE